MKKLNQYLQKIKVGKPINYAQFVKLLPANIVVDKGLIFDAQMIGPQQYLVKVLDQRQFANLLAASEGDITTRVEAALMGDSHQVVTSCGFLLVYHQQSVESRPDVVVVNQSGCNQGFNSKKTLLVIENQENFFCYQQMLPILSEFCSQKLDLSCCDIVFGLGQQINKALNLSFIDQYDELLCAFDYDLGGLRMVESLKQNVRAKVELLQPEDFVLWYDYFRKVPENDKHLTGAIELAEKLQYSQLAKVFVDRAKFLEQEVFLAVN